MTGQLPNLELLQYKAEEILLKTPAFKDKLEEYIRSRNDLSGTAPVQEYAIPTEFNVECFPQIWGSTATGFDTNESGEPMCGGSAMTKEYTTVVHELYSDMYVVFFGDKGCYTVMHASDVFLKDLKNKNLKPLSKAMREY